MSDEWLRKCKIEIEIDQDTGESVLTLRTPDATPLVLNFKNVKCQLGSIRANRTQQSLMERPLDASRVSLEFSGELAPRKLPR